MFVLWTGMAGVRGDVDDAPARSSSLAPDLEHPRTNKDMHGLDLG